MRSSLCLGYPCSVDAAVDPVEFVEAMIKRIKRLEEPGGEQINTQQHLRKTLYEFIPGSSMDSNDEELIKKAVFKDMTMMKGDMKLVCELSKKMDFKPSDVNTFMSVIDGIDNERIRNVKAFLTNPCTEQYHSISLSLWTWTD